MSHRVPLQLPFGEFDSAGIVYYPRYLHWCHVAMETFFRDVVGVDYPTFVNERRLGLPTVRTEVEHRRPIRYGDPVELEVAVTRVGGSSVEWRFEFWLPGETRAATEARVVTVLVDMDDFTKRAIPEWLRERLARAT